MKNVSVFSAFIILSLFVLAACSSDSNDSAKDKGESGVTNLTFWAPFSGGDADFMKELINDFNGENEEIQVDYLTVSDSEYYTKLRTAITSKQAPDIAIAHASRIAELESTNLIEDLGEPAIEASVDWDSYNQNILSSTKVNDKHFAIPLDTHALIMFANKDILEDAGVLDENGLPDMGEGADDFIKFLTQIKNNTADEIFALSATSNGYSTLRIWWTLYSQMGGDLLNEDGTKANFNNEKGLQALEFMSDLMEQDLWPKNIQNGGEIFTANRAGIHLNGVWMTGALENNENLDFIAMPIPQLFEEQGTWGDSHTFVLPSNEDQSAERRVASLKFADWIAENSSSWAEAGHVPSKNSVISSDEFNELEYRKDYAELTDYVSFMPPSPKITSINDLMAQHITAFMSGQASEQETLDTLESEVNNILSNK